MICSIIVDNNFEIGICEKVHIVVKTGYTNPSERRKQEWPAGTMKRRICHFSAKQRRWLSRKTAQSRQIQDGYETSCRRVFLLNRGLLFIYLNDNGRTLKLWRLQKRLMRLWISRIASGKSSCFLVCNQLQIPYNTLKPDKKAALLSAISKSKILGKLGKHSRGKRKHKK